MAAAGTGGAAVGDDFFVRYYVGHKGRFGHEFMEFEFRGDGTLRYANNSNYKRDKMIRKQGVGCGEASCNECVELTDSPWTHMLLSLHHTARISEAVLSEVRKIVEDSGIVE
jgi:hypothetical protein